MAFGHPFFSRTSRWNRCPLVEFLEAAPNGLATTAQKLSNITDAAASKFEGFDGGVDSAIVFAERLKELLHRAFDIDGIFDDHGGILPVLPTLLCGCRRLP